MLPALSYLPKEGKWLGTQYDVYGRPMVGFASGLAASPLNPNSFNITANDLLSETFYDGQSGGGITRTATAIDKGRVTTTRSRILGTRWHKSCTTANCWFNVFRLKTRWRKSCPATDCWFNVFYVEFQAQRTIFLEPDK